MPTVEKIIEKMKTSPNSITERELLGEKDENR